MSRHMRKTEAADLRSRYAIFLQIGFVVSLTLLVYAFNRHMTTEIAAYPLEAPYETVVFEEIQPTVQYQPVPPPPPLPPPIAVDDLIDMLDDLTFAEEPDFTAVRVAPPPPLLPPTDPDPIPEPVIRDEIFVVVEEPPVAIGGLEGIQSRVVYPETAIRARVEGRVLVQFVVGVDGLTRDFEILRSVCPACDEAAIEAIRNTRFEPGYQRGQAVPVRLSIPITFRLQ